MYDLTQGKIRLLLIEDDEDDWVLIRDLLSRITSAEYDMTWVQTYEDGLKKLRDGTFDACILDYRLGTGTGLEVLEQVSDCPDKPPIIILTGHGDYQVDLEAMRMGASDFLVKDQIAEHLLERTIRYAIERKKSEAALRSSEKQLDYLSSQLLLVQENERRKLASELHDNLGQVLTAIKYIVEGVLNRLPVDSFGSEDLWQVIPMIQGAIEQVRRIYTELRPSVLDDLGVLATLNWYCREFENTNKQIRVTKHFEIEEEAIPDSLKLVIFRIVQDAMNNIAAHSGASNVRLSLYTENGPTILRIEDDGKGFDVSAMMSQTELDSGLGLRSMKRRAQLSGGEIDIKSGKGKGTRVRVLWSNGPLPPGCTGNAHRETRNSAGGTR